MLERIWKAYLRRSKLSLWSLLSPPLALAAIVYRSLQLIHDFSVRSKYRSTLPVISIGNLTVGGSGKTPLVNTVARFLLNDGLRVGIVAAGYGRLSRTPLLKAGYKVQAMGVGETGDEVYLLAQNLPEAMFAVDESKAVAARKLTESGLVDIIIVDDGFQHRPLARDVDIVAYDAAVKRRLLRPFPLGILRESLNALKRADILIITRSGFARDLAKLKARLGRIAPNSSIYSARFPISELVGRSEKLPVKYLEDKSVFLFAGIGNFEPLRRQVEALAGDLDSALELADHQDYDLKLLERIKKLADSEESDLILTTHKDMVKIRDFDFGRETYYLAQTVDLDPGEERLIASLEKRLGLEHRKT